MKIYDITVPLSEDLPVFPGDPPVRIGPVTRVAGGDDANVSIVSLSSHSGTHLDPPRHFNDHGIPIDQIPLTTLVGNVLLVEITSPRSIDRAALERFPIRGEERLILKTGNSRFWESPSFCPDFSHLTEDGARYLVDLGVRLVGIDYLSVERFGGDGNVHRTLLDGGVIILEGLKLDEVPAGSYELICLPMKLKDGDGAPARAILLSRREHQTERGGEKFSSMGKE